MQPLQLVPSLSLPRPRQSYLYVEQHSSIRTPAGKILRPLLVVVLELDVDSLLELPAHDADALADRALRHADAARVVCALSVGVVPSSDAVRLAPARDAVGLVLVLVLILVLVAVAVLLLARGLGGGRRLGRGGGAGVRVVGGDARLAQDALHDLAVGGALAGAQQVEDVVAQVVGPAGGGELVGEGAVDGGQGRVRDERRVQRVLQLRRERRRRVRGGGVRDRLLRRHRGFVSAAGGTRKKEITRRWMRLTPADGPGAEVTGLVFQEGRPRALGGLGGWRGAFTEAARPVCGEKKFEAQVGGLGAVAGVLADDEGEKLWR